MTATLLMKPTDERLPLYRWAVGIPERYLNKAFLHGGHWGPECVGYVLQPRLSPTRYNEVSGPQKLNGQALRHGKWLPGGGQ
jgi:hypothetical protein